MSQIVISVENLAKAYRLGQIGTGTLSRDINVWWAKVRGKPNPMLKIGEAGFDNRDGDTIWALKDVNFTVEQGEVLGIIGRNGAGKSTLLKILSRVTAPTNGHARVKGQIASLLEVGTGFHPDLTGRENIYLNGAILGMTRQGVHRKLDEIMAFAEIEQFIDTPVKRYSSGMYVRLAFAVAAHLDPEILVVDEVLAVGDYKFQEKCLDKMGDIANQGRTVLLVSHNMSSVLNLCDRCILLDNGQILADGEVKKVVEQYRNVKMSKTGEVLWSNLQTAPGGDEARIHSVRILDEDGQIRSEVDISKGFDIEVIYWNLKENARIMCSIQLMDRLGNMVLSSFNVKSASDIPDPLANQPIPVGLYCSRCRIPGNFLNEGVYSLNIFIEYYANVNVYLAYQHDAISFTVQDTGAMRKEYSGGWGGVVRPRLNWVTSQVVKGL